MTHYIHGYEGILNKFLLYLLQNIIFRNKIISESVEHNVEE